MIRKRLDGYKWFLILSMVDSLSVVFFSEWTRARTSWTAYFWASTSIFNPPVESFPALIILISETLCHIKSWMKQRN